MKNNYLLLFLMSLGLNLAAQNCNFSYNLVAGTTLVQFSPNSAFSPNLYHFIWNFGDGTVDSTAYPTHAYNAVSPVTACCDIYDTANTIICSSCATITFQTTGNCFYTYQNTTGNTFVFQTQGVTGGVITWTFGDGTSGTGDPVTHTYSQGGQYTVVMFLNDSVTGTNICQNGQGIVVGTSNNCSFLAINSPVSSYVFDFTAQATPGSLVTWNFGDNTTDTGTQVTHTYNAPGTYIACINSTDALGITCTYCQVVQVSGNGNCFFSFAPDPNNSSTYVFAGVNAYPGSSLTWDFNDGMTGSGTTVTHTFSIPGTYTVCMFERDSLGTLLCTTCNSLTITGANSCSFAGFPDSTNALTINFQVTNGSGATATWDFGDGSTGTGFSPQHTYATPGVYQVCLNIGAGGMITCTSCNLVTAGSPGQCSISYYPDPFSSNTFVFNSSTSSNTSSIQWTFGDGSMGTGQSVTHTYNAAGNYSVCITEWDFLQQVVCQSCMNITVQGNVPAPCQASFLATANGLNAYFIDMSVTNSSAVTYSWDFGDNTTSSIRFPQHTYALPGAYTVCLSINTGNCADTFCSTLVADTTVQNPSGSCNAFFALVQLAPYQVSVVNLSGGLNLSFDWDFGDGSPHDNNPYPSHYYTNTGSYNLCLTVADANGCTSSYCDTLNIDTLGNIFRTATPGFTLNVLSPAQLTGVNEIKTQKLFSVFPNPVTSELHVSSITGNANAKRFRILSYLGEEILSGNLRGTEGTIPAQSLSSGTYLLEITGTDGSRSYQSIVKE